MRRNRRTRSSDPPHAKNGGTADGNQPPNSNREYRAITAAIKSISQTLVDNHKTDDDQNSTYQSKALFWNRGTFWVVIVYTVLTSMLVILNKCGLDTSKSFMGVQRAFVVISGMKQEVNRDANGKTVSFIFTPVIRNSGNTPTKDMEFVAISPFDEVRGNGYDPNAALPPDPVEQFNNPVFEYDRGKYVLGPQDILPPLIKTFSIDSSAFADIIGGRIGSFFYGQSGIGIYSLIRRPISLSTALPSITLKSALTVFPWLPTQLPPLA